MKKLLLSFALAFATICTKAQLSTPALWEKPANGVAYSWFTNDNSTTSCAYNPITDKLYVTVRNSQIHVINPLNGNVTGSLTLPATEAGEGLRFNKIRVTSNGVIYVTYLQTGLLNTDLRKIYRWDNEAATPTLAASFIATERTGDSFAVSGTGVNTVLYVAGSSGTNIYVLTTANGTTFSLSSTIALGITNFRSISPIGTGAASDLWVSSPSSSVRRINSSGTANYTIPNTSIPDLFSMAEYFTVGNQKYLAVVAANNATLGILFRLYNITNEAAVVPADRVRLYGSASLSTAYATNSNVNGDVAIKKNGEDSYTFFSLITNNGLMAVTNTQTLPVSLTSFDAALVNGQSTLTWETASEKNNSGFEVLRSTDGKDFTKIHFENSKGQNGNSTTALKYSFVDRTAKAGTNYYQLNQVDLDGKNELFKDVKSVKVSLGAADLVVFPNPATTYISVNAGGADFKGVKYEFFDVSGKRVLSEKATAEQQDISLSKLPASIYFLKISKNGALQKTIKLVKQ